MLFIHAKDLFWINGHQLEQNIKKNRTCVLRKQLCGTTWEILFVSPLKMATSKINPKAGENQKKKQTNLPDPH